LATVTNPQIDEASGMVVSNLHPGVDWLVNDSGNSAVVYGLDDSGKTVAELTLRGVYNRDWEAMAPGVDDNGDPALWIADIGDNDSTWDTMRVLRISEPVDLTSQTVQWRRVEMQYPDGAHNAEGFMVDDKGRLFVVTKQALGAPVYRTPEPPEFGTVAQLERVGPAPVFVTDAALSPNGKQVALRSYTSLFLYNADSFLNGGTKGGDPGTVYPLPLQPQGESLSYNDDGSAVVIGTEGVNQPLYQLTLPKQGSHSLAADDESGSSGKSLAIGIAVILLVGVVAGLITRRRSGGSPDVREDQASSPTT